MPIALGELDLDEVLRYMGTPPSQAGPELRALAEECGRAVCAAARPRWAWRAFDIAEEEGGVRLSCGLLLPGQDLKRHLRGCGRAAVFCATLSAQVDALIAEISGQESQVKAAEAKLQAAANAADAEIRAAEKELASQIANVPSESGFLWPLPGRYNLSSLYGSRKHPVTGKANNHTGIDVPAPSGTPIQACKSGVVTTSTYNNSYGNYVVVSHSDGTSTLYAHMSRRNASKGQTVSQGQVIGYVGTTGSSTGNHLHLEIRVNGSRRDPINYFQSLPLTISGVRIK